MCKRQLRHSHIRVGFVEGLLNLQRKNATDGTYNGTITVTDSVTGLTGVGYLRLTTT